MRAVLFDLDGVLIDSEKVNVSAGVLAFRDVGIKLSKSEQELIVGRHPADYDKVFKYKFDKALMVRLHHKYYFELYKKCKPFSSAINFVKYVQKKGWKTALVTSSGIKTVRIALKILGVKFDELVTFEDCKKRKPAPDAYLIAAKKLKVSPKSCMVVEDSIPGVDAAKRAGMFCVAVTNSFPKKKLSRADLIVSSLNDKRLISHVDF